MLTESKTSNNIKTALMAVLIAACAWISIPTEIPFTMQTFGVFLTLRLMKGKYGTLSVLIYILLGAIGAPVFAGFSSGIGILLGPTGGYIIGFLFSGIAYMILEQYMHSKITENIVLLFGLIICYAFGTTWFVYVMSSRGSSYSFGQALMLCVLPYLIPDLCKLALSQLVADRVSRAFNSRELPMLKSTGFPLRRQ